MKHIERKHQKAVSCETKVEELSSGEYLFFFVQTADTFSVVLITSVKRRTTDLAHESNPYPPKFA